MDTVVVNGVRLRADAVNAARERFTYGTRGNKRTCKLSFDELLQRFLDPCAKHRAIAKQAGISYQCIGHIFFLHFAPILPSTRRTRIQSKQICILRRQHAARVLYSEWLGPFLDRALKQGLKPRVLKRRHGDKEQWPVILNGRNCVVRRGTTRFMNHDREYCRVRVSKAALDQVDFFVLLSELPGYDPHLFVLPSVLLLGKYRWERNRAVSLYLPLIRPKGTPRTLPRISWWDYADEEGWQLFEKAATDVAA